MSDFLSEQHLNWRTARQLARWLAAFAATGALMVLPSLLETPSPPSPARITTVTLETAEGRTSRAFLGDVTLGPGRHGVLRINLYAAGAPPETPHALYLAGVFSARVTLNGVDLGTKGAPGPTRDAEQPGPIDVVLPIPANLLHQGDNELVLDMSAHAVGYPIESVFHSVRGDNGISIGPYSGDARRPIAQYAVPFMMLGILTLALVALIMQGALRLGDRRWEVVFVAALLIAASAEMARAIIDYPYPWHGVRMGVLTFALAAASFALAMIGGAFADAPRRLYLALAAGAVLATFALFANSFDDRTSDMIAAGAALGAGLAAWGASKRQPNCLELAAAMIFVLGFALFSSNLTLLDSALYASVLPLIALITLGHRGPAPELLAQTAELVARVAIGGANRRRVVRLADIKAVHGAGNYAEFELITGERVLDERKLAEWSERLPATFFRVHRSHIVNLEHTRALLTLGAGKYEVEMADLARVPLARGRVRKLRALIETMGLLSSEATAE